MPGREVKLAPDGEVLVRGDVISGATWQGGELRPRPDGWLATGDLAERQDSGELRFLGRKSEVIVTAAGVNIHPEDIESAIEEQPDVAACAVVAIETPAGPEPCAVLACRGSGECATAAVERANAKLPEFQRISRWVMWPEPDLPRTSTGKVRRKPVAAWLARIHAAGTAPSNGSPHAVTNGAFGPSSDWLLALITQITGESHTGVGDELRLTEDLHLDSLGRVQLAAAIEERLGIVESNGLLEDVQTLGEMRKRVSGEAAADSESSAGAPAPAPRIETRQTTAANENVEPSVIPVQPSSVPAPLQREAPRMRFHYPQWPWWKPLQWIRVVFQEAIARPLTWFLAAPRVVGSAHPLPPGPLLIIGNHVTAYDGALIEYALPGTFRRWIAVAMMGEMLEDFRHFRNPDWPPGHKGFYILGPPAYWLVTALYNVFPLPRHRDFQASFAHAGKAMDRGYSVMVFPEGTRSAAGQLAKFRPGIGLLVKQSYVPVLPVAIRGLGELKTGKRRWFRSGTIEVRVGHAIEFPPEETEAAITARLHAEVDRLLTGAG
jgi:long-chain acyl-CoA synthetase